MLAAAPLSPKPATTSWMSGAVGAATRWPRATRETPALRPKASTPASSKDALRFTLETFLLLNHAVGHVSRSLEHRLHEGEPIFAQVAHSIPLHLRQLRAKQQR